MNKLILNFKSKDSKKIKEPKNFLGGKGANLSEMGRLGLPVPPGFTISTKVCEIFYKDKKNTRNTFPLFIFTFILAIFVGNQLNLSDMTSSFLKDASSALLIGALFCIGTQINSKSIKNIDFKTIFFALLLWLFAIAASYYLVKVL